MNGNALTPNSEEEEIRWLMAYERYQAALAEFDCARPHTEPLEQPRRPIRPPHQRPVQDVTDTSRLTSQPARGASQNSRGAARPAQNIPHIPQGGHTEIPQAAQEALRALRGAPRLRTQTPQRSRSLGRQWELSDPPILDGLNGFQYDDLELILIRNENEKILQQQEAMRAQNEEMLRRIAALAQGTAIPPPPVKIYERGYVPGSGTDKESVHSFEKQVLNDAGRVILNPNIIADTVFNGMIHTRSGIRYIKAMAKRCTMIPDSRAATLLALVCIRQLGKSCKHTTNPMYEGYRTELRTRRITGHTYASTSRSATQDRKSTRLNSSHDLASRMPSSA